MKISLWLFPSKFQLNLIFLVEFIVFHILANHSSSQLLENSLILNYILSFSKCMKYSFNFASFSKVNDGDRAYSLVQPHLSKIQFNLIFLSEFFRFLLINKPLLVSFSFQNVKNGAFSDGI